MTFEVCGSKLCYCRLPSGGEDFEPEIPEAMQKTKQKNLYDNFVKKRDQEERKEAGEKPVIIKVVVMFLLFI